MYVRVRYDEKKNKQRHNLHIELRIVKTGQHFVQELDLQDYGNKYNDVTEQLDERKYHKHWIDITQDNMLYWHQQRQKLVASREVFRQCTFVSLNYGKA